MVLKLLKLKGLASCTAKLSDYIPIGDTIIIKEQPSKALNEQQKSLFKHLVMGFDKYLMSILKFIYCISGYFRVELIFAIFASDYKTRK